MDRCALFVDAGYALADGAMAVHGTRRRDSVSWDYAGLLKLFSGLARDRTGMPVLRCYWYEAAADGRRTAEHDALAEMPGLKLRLVNVRPGRREGIEAQLRRDLITLAKNGAVSDVFIASADDSLAELVAEVQDLGLRVIILHIATDGGWTIPQPLRQECDDIVEISGVHLRPFVELIRGAEPASPDEQFASADFGGLAFSDAGNSMVGALTHQGLPAAALPAPGVVYPLPSGPDYGQGSQQYDGAGLMRQNLQTTFPSGSGVPQPGGQPSQTAQPQSAGVAHSPGPSGPGQNGPGHGDLSQTGPGVQGGMPQSGYQNGASQNGSYQGSTLTGASQNGIPQGAYQMGASQNGPAQASTAQNGPVQGSATQNGLAQAGPPRGGAGQNGPAQAGAVQIGPAQGGAGQNGPAQGGAGQNGPAHGGQAQGGAGQNGPAQGAPAHSGMSQGGPGHHGMPQASYQNGIAQSGVTQIGTTPNGSMQNGAGQDGNPPSGMPQGGFQNGTVQNGVPQGGFSNGTVQNGMPPGGYQSAASQGSYQGGQAQSLQAQSGSAQGGSAQGGPVQSGAYQNDLYAGSPHSGSHASPPGVVRAGFDAAPVGGQQQHYYGAHDQGYFPGQSGATGADQGSRVPYQGQQPAPAAGTAFPPQAPYGAPQQTVAQAPAARGIQAAAISLPEAVKAAHGEGFAFGESVGRDAPVLWLEAVLARKPRMPSDLEARLLQGSALPIDSLLHDEVRHSLRRGFWDALENARR